MDAPGFDAEGLSAEELRQRLSALQAILARAPVPIAIAHDRDCRFVSGNRALSALLGVSPDTNLSMTPPEGEPAPYRIQRQGKDVPTPELPMQYAIANRTPVSNEIEIVRADGRVLYVQNDVEPLYDAQGRIYGCVSVCVDVTDRKLAEKALLDADRRKDEFLATLSHELRNPLAAMRAAVEVMRRAPEEGPLVRKAQGTVERQLKHLVRITDDLLDVTRIARDIMELRREHVDVRSVVHNAAEAMRPMIESRSQVLMVDLPAEPLWSHADSVRLAQIFSNLLQNASKYTPRGGEIRITGARAGEAIEVSVEDTGVGIPPDMLPRIFDMFTQLQTHSDRTQGGLGIGLTLVRRLVELHGGKIHASSDGPGRGSRFRVRLPAGESAGAPQEAARPPAPQPKKHCRVLVADDNPDTAEMMRVMLGFSGHDVRVASDGVQAVELAREFAPDIAFLDIGMPRMDGYEAARRIRELGGRTVLVALTGWGQDEDKQRSREAGFDHHVTKPPEPEELERLIGDCGISR
jgi:two-component system CheB/CheR fusion protein